MNRMTCLILVGLIGAFVRVPAEAEKVVLTSGELLIAPITHRNEKAITLAHRVLGVLVVPADKIQGIYADDADLSAIQPVAPAEAPATSAAPATAKAAAPAPTEPARPVLPPAPDSFFWGWESTLDVGFSGSTGNTEALNLYSAFTSKKETDEDRWDFDTSIFYAKNEGRKTQNKFTAGLTKDWLLPDNPWFYYAQGRFDYDEFRSWDKRISAGGGMGYQWVKEDHFEWLSRAGGNATKEFGSDNTGIRPEIMAGNEIVWKFLTDQKLTGSSYIYPDLIDFGEFRLVNALDWTWKLSNEKNISLKFGLKHDYESDVSAGIKHNDLKYYGALTFEF